MQTTSVPQPGASPHTEPARRTDAARAWIERALASPELRTVLACGACLAAYAWLRPRLFAWTLLDEAAYFEPVLAWEALKRAPLAALLVVLGALPALRARATHWSRLDGGAALRWLVAGTCLVLAWSFATLDYNFYYDRWHALDRALLAGTALLVLLHPVFTAPFLLLALVFVGQLAHPLGAPSWTDKAPLVNLLLLFCVFVGIHALRRLEARVFLTLALACHAADYVIPAFGKLEIGWTAQERLANLWMAAHLHGWLPGLAEAQAFRVADALAALSAPLLWGTLAVELAPLLVLASRPGAVAILAAATALHVGIFATSGICFWKWMLLNALLVVPIVGPERARFAGAFGARSVCFWLSLPLIAGGAAFFDPVRLAWFDTPLTHVYALEAVSPEGEARPVGADFLAPYDLFFAQNRLAHLVEEPHLAMTFSTSRDPQVVRALADASSAAEVLRLDAHLGRPHGDPVRAHRFEHFARRFFAGLDRAGGPRRVALGAPLHIPLGAGPDAYDGRSEVARLRVRWRSLWWHEGRVHVLRDRVVREVPIPDAGGR